MPEHPPSPTRPASKAVLALASLGFFLITLDVSIVNLALPSITEDLGGGTSAQQWVLDGYTLLFAALLLACGNMSDRFGAKRAYAAGILLFGVTSLLCALAPSSTWLIAARCAQGAAAALMLPASMTLIREAFPEARTRAKALGVWAAGGAVASAAGPVLGGALSTWDWRAIFAVNVPVCAAMLLLATRAETSSQRRAPFDWGGQALALLALASILFGLIEGGVVGYSQPWILALLALGSACLVLFVAVQARSEHPMMPLALFRHPAMRVAIFGGFAFIYSWFGSVFVASIYLQQELQIAPALAGLVFVPGAILAFAGNLASGPLANARGPRFTLVLGMASLIVGLGALSIAGSVSSPTLVAISIALIGGGGSVAMPPLAGVVLEHAPEGQAGVASAVSNTFRQIGGALAVALFGVLVAGEDRFVQGMQSALLTGAVLAGICVLLSGALVRTGRR